MTRARRRPKPPPPTVSPKAALAHHLNGTWPTRKEENQFWKTTPFNWASRPDPRPLLFSAEGAARYRAEFDRWETARTQWLREQADG